MILHLLCKFNEISKALHQVNYSLPLILSCGRGTSNSVYRLPSQRPNSINLTSFTPLKLVSYSFHLLL